MHMKKTIVSLCMFCFMVLFILGISNAVSSYGETANTGVEDKSDEIQTTIEQTTELITEKQTTIPQKLPESL